MAVIWIYCITDTFESISWNNSAISLYNIQFSINTNNNKTVFSDHGPLHGGTHFIPLQTDLK